jgi:hypothetical protein
LHGSIICSTFAADFRKKQLIMLKNILAITGKPGLYKLISHGNNMLIVESLVDGKRMPTYGRDKIVSLADVSMFTEDEDLPLSEVLTRLGKKEGLKLASIDAKKADNDELRKFFGEVVENFDRDRVYPSDIRKLISWYNILIGAGITDFTVEEEAEGEEVKAEAKPKEEVKKAAVKNTAAKAQRKVTSASAKTGVGAKKG